MSHSDERDEGASTRKPAKRFRVSQACEPCRLKKGKCDGRQPVCNVCRRYGIDCSYNPKPQKRGLRPGQYSMLERRAFLSEVVAAVLLDKMPDAEEHLHQFFSPHDPELPFLALGPKRDEFEQLLEHWKQSPITQWLVQVSAQSDPTLDRMSRMRSNQVLGIEPPTSTNSADNENRVRESNTVAGSRPALSPQSAPGDVAAKTLPTLPPDIEERFDDFFAYIHTWLPFVDKFKLRAVVRSQSTWPQRVSELTSSQSADISLTWAVIACASSRRPPSQESSNGVIHLNPLEAARASLSLIPVLDADMDNQFVQALILLSIVYFERGNHRLSWLLIGIAGRVAPNLSHAMLGPHVSSQSRRTTLACFVVEAMIAATLDRDSQLPTLCNKHQTYKKDLPFQTCEIEAEGWEEWSTWEMPGCTQAAMSSSTQRDSFRVLSTFNHTIRLTEILNGTKLPPAMRSMDFSSSMVDSLLDGPFELSTWTHDVIDLHPCLSPRNISDATFPHEMNLHAVYLLIRCVSHLKMMKADVDRQQYKDISLGLASSVIDLTERYQSVYPRGPIPIGITAAVITASRLLSPDDVLFHSLRSSMPIIGSSGEAKLPSDSHNRILPFSRMNAVLGPTNCGLFGTESGFITQRDQTQTGHSHQHHVDSGRGLPIASQDPIPTALHMDLPLDPSNMPGTLDIDRMSMYMGETSSLSAHDLTVLDAAVWNDKLLTENLGFVGDSQAFPDPDLSHLFDTFPPVE